MKKETILAGGEKFTTFYTGALAMVTAVNQAGVVDICTISDWSWLNNRPPLYGIPLCNRTVEGDEKSFKRFTLQSIEETREFVLNLPGPRLQEALMVCGRVSLTREPGADKFALAGLTPTPASSVRAPLIAECAANIECRVREIIHLPDHDWVIGEALAVHRAFEDTGHPMSLAVMSCSEVCASMPRLAD